MPCVRGRLAASFVIFLTLAGLRVASADDTPEDALKAKGLRRSGAFFVLPAEAELAKRLGQLRSMLNELSQASAQQKALEFDSESSKKLIKAYSEQRRLLRQRLPLAGSPDERNQMVETMNELGDRINSLIEGGDNTKTVKELNARVGSKREAYVQALLNTRASIDETNKTYTELEQDNAVKMALAELNKDKKSPIKLGPTRSYQSNVKLFEKLEGSLLTETIALREQGGVFLVDTVLNGKISRPLIFDTGASIVSLPADIANDLGLKPTDEAPTIQIRTANGSVHEAKLMTLKSVRVGKFEVENVQCAVLPESFSNAPALLGSTFWRNFAYKIVPETGKLTLSQVNTATPDRPARQSAKKKK